MTNPFAFLQAEWPAVSEAAGKAAMAVHPDPDGERDRRHRHVEKAKQESHGLGLFVRSLVGLDREAAKQAFAGFLGGKTLAANQIEFVDLIVNHLTEHGVMDASLLYESPFTDLTPIGPEGLFTPPQLDELFAVLDQVRASALAA